MRALAETLCQLLEYEMRHGFASIDNTVVLFCSSGLVGASCAHRVPVFLRSARHFLALPEKRVYTEEKSTYSRSPKNPSVPHVDMSFNSYISHKTDD